MKQKRTYVATAVVAIRKKKTDGFVDQKEFVGTFRTKSKFPEKKASKKLSKMFSKKHQITDVRVKEATII